MATLQSISQGSKKLYSYKSVVLATCNTDPDVAIKQVDGSAILEDSLVVGITFTHGNNCGSFTIDYNDLGELNVYNGGNLVSWPNNSCRWSAGTTVYFMYVVSTSTARWEYIGQSPEHPNVWYGVCSSNPTDTVKTITFNEEITLKPGTIIYVTFTNNNQLNSFKLGIGTSEFIVCVGQDQINSSNPLKWLKNESVGFIYDGTLFNCFTRSGLTNAWNSWELAKIDVPNPNKLPSRDGSPFRYTLFVNRILGVAHLLVDIEGQTVEVKPYTKVIQVNDRTLWPREQLSDDDICALPFWLNTANTYTIPANPNPEQGDEAYFRPNPIDAITPGSGTWQVKTTINNTNYWLMNDFPVYYGVDGGIYTSSSTRDVSVLKMDLFMPFSMLGIDGVTPSTYGQDEG